MDLSEGSRKRKTAEDSDDSDDQEDTSDSGIPLRFLARKKMTPVGILTSLLKVLILVCRRLFLTAQTKLEVFSCLHFILMALKIATLKWFAWSQQTHGYSSMLSHFAFDIVCLQESYVTSLEESRNWFSRYCYLAATSCGSNHSCGTVILFRPVLSLLSSFSDSNGRFVSCDFLYHDHRFRVVSLYALTRILRDMNFSSTYVFSMIDLNLPTLLCGDFNAVFNRISDRSGSDPNDCFRECSISLRRSFMIVVSLVPGSIILVIRLPVLLHGVNLIDLCHPELT